MYTKARVAYGCLRSSGRRVLLRRYFDDDIQARAAGRYAAVGSHGCDSHNSCVMDDVDVFDLKLQRRVSNVEMLDAGDLLGDLELRPTGAVAFISYTFIDDTSDAVFAWVWRMSRGGKRVRLDMGESIDPTSLSRKGTTITWTKGATVRSAQLR